jgi:hypothetical protein
MGKSYFYRIRIIITQFWRGIFFESNHTEDQEGDSMNLMEAGDEGERRRVVAVVED